MIKLQSPTGRCLQTDLNSKVLEVLEDEGILWFEAISRVAQISEKGFQQIDFLISPRPG